MEPLEPFPKAVYACLRIPWDSSGLKAGATRNSVSKVKQPAQGTKTFIIMKSSDNYIQMSGRLTADVTSNDKKTYARFCIVHNFIGDTDPLFLNCVIYKKEFDNNRQTIPWDMLEKGAEIFVTGKLTPNNWTDRDGVNHRGFEVVVNKIRDVDD